MTRGWERDAPTGASGNRRLHYSDAAAISWRGAELRRQIDDAQRLLPEHQQVRVRMMVPQSSERGAVIPAFRPPFLLDLVGIPVLMTAAILRDLAVMATWPQTIVLLASGDRAGWTLARSCPAVRVIVEAGTPVADWLPWLRYPLVTRPYHPVIVGKVMPADGATPYDVRLLHLLVALRSADTMRTAAERACIARRTFYHWLSEIRDLLGLPAAQHTRFHPESLLHALIAALAAGPPPAPGGHRPPVTPREAPWHGERAPFLSWRAAPAVYRTWRSATAVMMEIALAVSDPGTDDAWMELVARSGRVRRVPLGSAVVRELEVSLWVVVLDVRHPPASLLFWLQQMRAPLLLVTPHLAAAQALSAQIPHLALVCDPRDALRWMPDLVTMARTTVQGTALVRTVRAR